ncbi:hypothetical protein BDV25DRAFT_32988 [Aspergillus avenaceus]|uniref:Uncharacterized protein n=1 Tax=Aspergillus avenaceus TaxID=36643 RepID=A0A5N6TM90_ASPAV|nr:hypothetical protein BDV25DRAFT_32988 [Aspergillus avenaceus]
MQRRLQTDSLGVGAECPLDQRWETTFNQRPVSVIGTEGQKCNDSSMGSIFSIYHSRRKCFFFSFFLLPPYLIHFYHAWGLLGSGIVGFDIAFFFVFFYLLDKHRGCDTFLSDLRCVRGALVI